MRAKSIDTGDRITTVADPPTDKAADGADALRLLARRKCERVVTRGEA